MNQEVRLVISIPPIHYFYGFDRQNALPILGNLKKIFPNIFIFDCEIFWCGTKSERNNLINSAKLFRPNIGLALPNAGYGILLNFDSQTCFGRSIQKLLPEWARVILNWEGASKNILTEELGVPLLLFWDHIITQAADYLSQDLSSYRGHSKSGMINKIISGLSNPKYFHYIPDTGHIDVMNSYELLPKKNIKHYVVGGHSEFLIHGEQSKCRYKISDAFIFTGNLMNPEKIHANFADREIIERIREYIIFKKKENIIGSTWGYFEQAVERERNFGCKELTPDHEYFWRLALDLLSNTITSQVRLDFLKSLDCKIDFYGGFADPNYMKHVSSNGFISHKGSYQISELPYFYDKYQCAIDVTNSPFIHGSNAKVLDCFASGGFMFLDKKIDLYKEIGSEISDYFMYQSTEDLMNRVETIKSNDSLRLSVIREMQNLIKSSLNIENVFAKAVKEVVFSQ